VCIFTQHISSHIPSQVCNHPLLVLTPTHPLYATCMAHASGAGGLHALACAPKLLALQQILHECGIGNADAPAAAGGAAAAREGSVGDGDGPDASGACATHRALVFSQSGALLDLVESDLLTTHMPSTSYVSRLTSSHLISSLLIPSHLHMPSTSYVRPLISSHPIPSHLISSAHGVHRVRQLHVSSHLISTSSHLAPRGRYVRLDGAVPPSERAGLARRFNADPSIDLMLLTTAVGGLGLNLTGADVVIFLDHDWNPMKDLQVRYSP
jgi:SNF2 family DNA or RNA helicase